MVEHIPLVRVHIARWGTADKGCWLSATFMSKFTSIFIASTTILARRLLTIGGCGSLPPRKCRADDASNSNKNSCESRGPPLFSDWGWRLVGATNPDYAPTSAPRLPECQVKSIHKQQTTIHYVAERTARARLKEQAQSLWLVSCQIRLLDASHATCA